MNNHPTPQFARQNWHSLNGQWAFAFDDDRNGDSAHWAVNQLPGHQTITVPFVYQAELSGIGDTTDHPLVWYQRQVTMPHHPGERILLHFGAVDYAAAVYVDGQLVGTHTGGDTSFALDITTALTADTATVTVRVEDFPQDETIPRGKQSWTGRAESIWYTNSTGIWQSVWWEAVPTAHLTGLRLTPELATMAVQIDATVTAATQGRWLGLTISLQGEPVATDWVTITGPTVSRRVALSVARVFDTSYHGPGVTWSPEHPTLFDLTVTLADSPGATPFDTVTSYFGLRKIGRENGMIFLNDKPYYQRLVLDQGYWPKGLLTAPDDQALRQDIQLAKAMGFNGCRKHQKVADPRFLYWADKLGYLVWEEVASVPSFAPNAVTRLTTAWQETVQRDYNHPSIILWLPTNESWGVTRIHDDVAQQHFVAGLYHLLHALDGTRLVGTNDGWDNLGGDLIGIHNYAHGAPGDAKRYAAFTRQLATIAAGLQEAPTDHRIMAKHHHYAGQPIVLTEFGGVGFDQERPDGWGYTRAASAADYLSELARIMAPVADSTYLWGFCYTQLTDVQQEVNGLLTADRKPKVPLADLRQLFTWEQARLSETVSRWRATRSAPE